MTSKTFAIITDIHSNISALNNALDIIESRKNIDQIICLGDCFSLGPEPEETLKKLKEINNCIFVRGNHDRYIIEKLWEEELPTLEGIDPYDPICKAIVENEKWTAEKIGNEGVDFIRKMVISHREIVNSTLIEFTHAWYQRDDHPPSIEEALSWKKNVDASTKNIEKLIYYMKKIQNMANLFIFLPKQCIIPSFAWSEYTRINCTASHGQVLHRELSLSTLGTHGRRISKPDMNVTSAWQRVASSALSDQKINF